MSSEYKDRFTEAEKEQESRSGFVCESCNTKYTKGDAEKKAMSCCNRTMKELLSEGFGP